MFGESFWVAVAFLLFIGILFYYKVPAMLAKLLDDRGLRIRHQLDEAQRLREQAQAMFVEYQAKQRGALRDAADIVATAEAEVERQREAGEAELKNALARRRALAEARIRQAEAAAVQAVRSAAADLAVDAAKIVIADQMQGPAAGALVDRAIADLRSKLN
jgi:F-type H+-transporting ATPase subunit b